MDIPNWAKWLAVVVLVIWVMTDPKGLGSVISDLFDGLITVFRSFG